MMLLVTLAVLGMVTGQTTPTPCKLEDPSSAGTWYDLSPLTKAALPDYSVCGHIVPFSFLRD